MRTVNGSNRSLQPRPRHASLFTEKQVCSESPVIKLDYWLRLVAFEFLDCSLLVL